jgi:GTP-binding protein EngB required for normal cell division
MMLDFLNSQGIPYIIVATKCDKLNTTERRAAEATLVSHPKIANDTPIVFFSSLKGEGKAPLWQHISKAAGIRYK